jgi:2-dehydropantoate 2-reductase
MEIVVLGAGALGTILAAHLSKASHHVTVLARGERAAQLATGGLRVRGLAQLDAECRVVSTPGDIAGADLLIVTVKTYDNKAAVANFRGDSFRAVFSVANGVLKNAELAEQFGATRVLGCMADTSGELLPSGEANFTRNVCLHLGDRAGTLAGTADTVASTVNASGVSSRAATNIETIEWSKFVGWTALLALSVTTRLPTCRFLSDRYCASVATAMIKEMGALAAAMGIDVIDQSPLPVASIIVSPFDQARELLMAVGREWSSSAPGHRMSSLQDLDRGKPLEVHETLGYAVTRARELALATPTLATCYELVAGISTTASAGGIST